MFSIFNKTLATDEYLVEILQKKILREDTQIADDKKCQTLVTSKLNFEKEKCGSPWKMQKDSGEEKTSPCFCSLPSICHFLYYCILRPESFHYRRAVVANIRYGFKPDKGPNNDPRVLTNGPELSLRGAVKS